jgi:Do/DeqQ family serine protease
MNQRSVPGAVVFLILTLVAGAASGIGGPSVSRPKPALRIDRAPLSDSRAHLAVSYADVVEPVQKTVVSIYSIKRIRERLQINPMLRQLFPYLPDQERESTEEGLGSGVIVSPDGYIITNNHVVEGADELTVSLNDGREFPAEMIGTDPKTDLAVIRIDADDLPVITLADSDQVRVGDIVFAVGNPLGVGLTVTMGIVSAKGRSVGILGDVGGYEDFIQTDAAINMGNSGGALVDARGRLVGVNSAILSPSRGSIGIGFAIPANLATWILTSLIETGSVARGYLGVESDQVTPTVAGQLGLPQATRGALISDIIPGGPAEKAGLRRTDVIVAINGHAISSQTELRLLVARIPPGEVALLNIYRDGAKRNLNVVLGGYVDNPDELLAGVTVQPLTPEDRRRLGLNPRVDGLLITDVAEDSPFRRQLVPGILIVEINRTPVADVAAGRDALRLQPNRALLAIYVRGSIRFVVVSVGDQR